MKRMTIRTRLTLIYGGLFVLGGGVLLTLTYFLVAARLPRVFGRASLPEGAVIGPDGGPARPAPEEVRRILVDAEKTIRDNTLEQLLTQGIFALLVVAAVAIALGWLLAGGALQPLHAITGTARRIANAGSGRGLHERITLRGPRDEVYELADTFNEMLERLDRSFDGQRRLVANASHEMRTPLAINRSLLELAVTRPDASPDLRRLAESLLQVNERHERLIDGLLTLADSENEITERSPVDLAEVATHVTEQLRTGDLSLARDLEAAPTTGDPILLERVMQNLVENAIKHNVERDGWLHVRTATEQGRATVTVTNTGPVIPAYEVETLFQPFRRLGRERVNGGRGFGLGLSIVRAVARAHGGEAVAVPRDGGGLIVTVRLPEA